jgi:hypothetical protein
MKPINLTFGQALRFLWSFIWRGWLLSIPVLIVMMVGMRFLMPFPAPGVPPQPPDPKHMALFFPLWLIAMLGFIVSQTFALRWTLKAQWSGFRVIAVSRSDNDEKFV